MTEHEHKHTGAPPTFLIVEHELALNQMLVDALQMEFNGIVYAVTTGRSAIRTARRVKPTLLIIDNELRDMDATALAKRLHEIKQLEHTPTIFIDSHMGSQMERPGYLIYFLRKPFLLQALYRAVRQALSASVDGSESPS